MHKYILLFLISFYSIFAHAQIDSCSFYRKQNDTLKHKLYVANKKVAKHTFYENICIKNPSQIRFLKSWQVRTNKVK